MLLSNVFVITLSGAPVASDRTALLVIVVILLQPRRQNRRGIETDVHAVVVQEYTSGLRQPDHSSIITSSPGRGR